jgi:hypothetical protein
MNAAAVLLALAAVLAGYRQPEALLALAFVVGTGILFWRGPAASGAACGAIALAWAVSWPQGSESHPSHLVSLGSSSAALLLGLCVFGWRVLVRLAPVLLALALVALFSGGRGGPDPMVARFVEWFGLTPEAARFWVVALRKGLHVLFYGFLAWAAARWASGAQVDRREAACFGVAAGLLAACFDEGRQWLTPGRGGTVADVFLDLAGMLVGTVAYWWPRGGRRVAPR